MISLVDITTLTYFAVYFKSKIAFCDEKIYQLFTSA